MSDKPSYLGLLNAIAVGESQAHAYLTAWIATTKNADVKCVLATVAAREGEHGMSFAKRVNELGYTVREREDVNFEKRLAIAGSGRSDLEKMEKLGFGQLDSTDKPDFFDDIFKNHSIDITTGELLGRYIAEERDSGRILRACYEQLCAAGEPAGKSTNGSDRLADLEAKVDAVCGAIDEVRSMLSTLASSANGSTNGRAKPARKVKV